MTDRAEDGPGGTTGPTVRIGVLGAARVVKTALTEPAREVPEVTVAALAARDPARAREHAARLGIPRVHDSYDALLADPELDAVYVALPNALHATWGERALRAGKHVLVEKPVTSNENEARQLARAAEETGRIVCEAMHPLYHPLNDRVRELLAAGTIGEIRHAEAHVAFPIPSAKDIRWSYELGGGALMDLGVYALALLRSYVGAGGEEEAALKDVEGALAPVRTKDVDRRVDARLRFAGGATGRIVATMWGWPPLASRCLVEGTAGRLTVLNPLGPQMFHRITVTAGGRRTRERVVKQPSTYACQLRAFARAVTGGEPLRSGPEQFVPAMAAIDAIYRRAGLPPRGAGAEAGRVAGETV
ncbi:Gfo/Idh/MocA family oxidoreductase [Streptomyces sp. DSM 44917]|uniref:Gfo/Idh/MocA family oxidoreductase n=1 Tax=Streptomyces boetiae TaxID=3075541 RepID=A0ABU2LC78_9ACTN|nr:Gfo/Idh/MocA family oxidoreductase [Streptomyces sp. DSM 44917]MDT0308863.1 Gfo/Idh/MocA family oxidoreductase [Streptomyces sp. DSM 44917]